jgi:hypothetical protein
MANTRSYARSFSGGEVTPEFWGRLDDAKYQTGAATIRNCIVTPHGPVTNRPGLAFVRAVKDSTKRTRLIPFSFSTTQTVAIEVSQGFFRFHINGQTQLVPAGTAYNGALAYVAGDVVTYTGNRYVAIAAAGIGIDPTNVFVPVPTPPAIWVASTALVDTPPVGYTFVGSTLPTSATLGSLVYIEVVTEVFVPETPPPGLEYEYLGLGEYVIVIKYQGYTGTAPGTAPDPLLKPWLLLGPATGNVIFEVANPYADADIFDLHYVQSNDVLTIVHPNYPPAELRRLGTTGLWTYKAISFGTPQVAPTSPSAVATRGSPASTAVRTFSYVVTSVSADGLSESVASVVATTGNQNLLDANAFNTITWTSSATRFNVYRLAGGLYSFVGISTSTTFVDDGTILPDAGKTPPISTLPFTGTNFPAAVSYFEQRRVFGGTNTQPQNVWATKSGTETDLNVSIPVRDDDSVQFRIASREANTIRHIVPLNAMLLLTSAAEWRAGSADNGPLSPLSISAKPQSYTGANNAQPIVLNNRAVYAAARGGHIREIGFDWRSDGFVTGDLSLRAPHLFDNFEVVDMAYAKSPQPVLWFVSSSGKLLGLTYVPDQEISAWHQHDSLNGVFESCCVVTEGSEDRLYVVVKRVINGATVRYVERMAPRLLTDVALSFFVDCGATYNGASADVITGLSHLEGQTVAVLADGSVQNQKVVTSGQITLDYAASKVVVGIPMTSELLTLPVGLIDIAGAGQGIAKNLNKVYLRVYNTRGLFAGPAQGPLREYKQRTTEVYGSPPNLKTGEAEFVVDGFWGEAGQVLVRQVDPLPMTVLSITSDIAIGD